VLQVLFFSALALLTPPAQAGQSLPARSGQVAELQHSRHAAAGVTRVVERVVDGDTVILRGAKERVRLANIDAPEMSHGYGKPGQPFSVEAARWMQRKVQGKAGTLRCPDEDRYGRPVCDLFLNGEHVNKELVRAGLAWANTARPRYVRDQTVFHAQQEARNQRRGLWAQGHPTPPWQCRQECWEKRRCAGAGSTAPLSRISAPLLRTRPSGG
jgi:micrococcal nuclease